MIEKRLIERCIKKDRKAISELYKMCYVSNLSVCLRYQNNRADAESVFNVSFMKILKSLKKYNSNYSFSSWTKRIIINANIDEFRKNRKVRELIHYQENSEEPNQDNNHFRDFHLQFTADDLESMVRELPAMSRKVFNLYAIDDYTHKEIGEVLEISEGTSKWHLFSARRKLKDKMNNELHRRKIVGYEK